MKRQTSISGGAALCASPVVRLSRASEKPVSFRFSTRPGTAGASDFVQASSTITFALGQASRSLPVQVVPDGVPEGEEHFFIDLDTPTNAEISDGQSRIVIVD